MLAPLVLAGLAALAVGCTDEKTVFVDRIFEDPPPGAQGFMGYDDEATELTVCGNCHVGQQGRWEGTAHSDAWATLQASGDAQPFCEDCHTTGPNGNDTSGDVGWAGTGDTRYYDVQCESCHGPGLDHVTAPDTPGTQPLASIEVGDSTSWSGCAECHRGVHQPFVEEWAQSKHAEVNATVRARAISDPAHYEECLDCHSAQGALEAWGIDSRFQEENATTAEHVGIVCAVCHDPHSAANEGQLRFPIDVPSTEGQLCMKCHHKRGEPEIESATIRGPHSPEGPLLLGEAGWWPPGFDLSGVQTSHGPAGNPKLCATCHVNDFTVTDELTGDFTFQATGHIFEAVPCLDATGKPVPGGECDVTERTFAACAGSGCHSSPAVAQGLYTFAKNDIQAKVDDVDALLAQVPPAEFNLSDGVFTVADGAWFNARLGELPGSPIHNPFLMRALLDASIDVLETTYGLASLEGTNRTRTLR
jgi:predicted CXXCH cytochrome family protein